MELLDEAKQIVNDLTTIINDSNIPPPEKDTLELREFLEIPLVKAYFKGIENRAVQLGNEKSNAIKEQVYYGLTMERLKNKE